MKSQGIGDESPSQITERLLIYAERSRIVKTLKEKGYSNTMIARIMTLTPNMVREMLRDTQTTTEGNPR